jgi:hypothetical protein
LGKSTGPKSGTQRSRPASSIDRSRMAGRAGHDAGHS